jgi:hypothetical protein
MNREFEAATMCRIHDSATRICHGILTLVPCRVVASIHTTVFDTSQLLVVMKVELADQTIQIFAKVFKCDSFVRFTERMLVIISVKIAAPCLNVVPHLARSRLHKFRGTLLESLQHLCRDKIVVAFYILKLSIPEDATCVVVIVM